MSSVTTTGIGSGLDINGIVNKLVELESKPLDQLQKQASTLQTRISIYGNVQSQLNTLKDAAAKLSQDAAWDVFNVTSSNSAAVSGSAAVGAFPVSTNISVQQLARGQVSASSTVTVDQQLSDGTLKIEQGSWATGVFVPSGGIVTSIDIAPGENTLSAIAAKINSSSGGVQAYVVRDSAGERLVLRSSETGQSQGFKVSITKANQGQGQGQGTAYTDLSFAAPSGAQVAQDALFTLDGVSLRSSTNTVTEAMPGVTLQLQQVTTSPVQVSISQDREAVKKSIQAMIDAYNNLNGTLANAMKYNPDTRQAAPLQGDSTAVGLQGALRGIFRTELPDLQVSKLLDIGVSVSLTGAMSIDSTKLNAALAKPENVRALFDTNVDGQPLGIARQVATFAKDAVDYGGRLAVRSESLQSAVRRNGREQEQVNDRVERARARLLAVYNGMDSKVGQLNALNTYVAQQLSSLKNNY